MKYILVLMLLAPLAHADCDHNSMDCTADSAVRINSFTDQATYIIGSITNARLVATKQLQAHKITVAQAEAVQRKADLARAIWQQARQACNANAEGMCTANSEQAFVLLESAKKAMQ